MPVKGQSSSRHKGKEVVSDPSATYDEDEEAMCSESDSSDKEEAWRPLDSECAPLIDPWYDVHFHFPKVLSDYTPLPPGHVWLALYRRNTEAPWAPLASSIPDLIIH